MVIGIADNRRCARTGASTISTDAPDGVVPQRQLATEDPAGHQPVGQLAHARHVQQQTAHTARRAGRSDTTKVINSM